MAYLSPSDRKFLDGLPLNPKRAPLRKIIDLFCKECTYDTAEPGTWRQQVGMCTCESCPLHKVRPRATVPLEEVA